MASGGYSSRTESAEQNFLCPVCLEILENPISLPCGHTFCNDCLSACENISGSAFCPVCRANFNTHQKFNATDIEWQIYQSRGYCSGCNRQFPMSRLRAHRSSCPRLSISSLLSDHSPVAATSQRLPGVNRSTFSCPYCYQSNLDNKGLLQHVNRNHKNERQSVVCPICASMPWGNPNQKSGNFVEHLNLRHKFEYDTYVDFSNDEDAVLQQVLAQSLQDH